MDDCARRQPQGSPEVCPKDPRGRVRKDIPGRGHMERPGHVRVHGMFREPQGLQG